MKTVAFVASLGIGLLAFVLGVFYPYKIQEWSINIWEPLTQSKHTFIRLYAKTMIMMVTGPSLIWQMRLIVGGAGALCIVIAFVIAASMLK